MLDLVAWAKKFIGIPSVSRDGNAVIARAAAALLREVGLEPKLIPAEHEGQEHFLVIADLPALHPYTAGTQSAAPGLILLTHLDTVPPGETQAWTATGGDPFRATCDGDRLFGLGSADAKVDLVCKAAALQGLDPARLRRPIRVVGTYAEEIGLVGARSFAASGGTEGFGFALVGEPSELVAIRAHKGYNVFEIRIPLASRNRAGEHVCRTVEIFEGRSAHSSTPHLGRNAIEAALERLADPEVLGVASFEGGSAVNMVPARAELAVCLREPPSAAFEKRPSTEKLENASYDPAPLVSFHRDWRRLLAGLRETVDPDFDPEYTVGNLGSVRLSGSEAVIRFDLRPVPDVEVMDVIKPLGRLGRIERIRNNPPLAAPPDGELLRHVTRAQAAIGIAPRVSTKATCTEAGLLAERGLEVLVLGAGTSVGNVHRPNEHTRISQLRMARDLYRAVIDGLCIGAE